ncbi:MAG: tyrosine-protein phosphatase [Pseudomonadota bacterium]
MSDERVIALEGVHNFRRFGVYPVADGRRVRDGLFRSGQFSRATDEDKAVLDALGIRTVADLRRPRERQMEPSHWPGVDGVRVIETDHAGPAEPPHMVFLRENELTFENIRDFMLATYKRLPFDPGNQHVFREGVKALAGASEDGEGFVVHCAAGKDRTGIFCALVLWEAGVDHDTVVDDYLMTNTAVDFDRIAAVMRERLAEKYGREFAEPELRAFLGVDGDYLDAAIEAIGDPRVYLRETLGLGDAVLSAMRDRLLAG